MRSIDRIMIFLLAAVAIICCMSVASACEICGYKYEEVCDGTSFVKHPVSGWTIYLFNQPVPAGTVPGPNVPGYLAQTTTGVDGKYCFKFDNYGKYYVYEEVRSGWSQLTGGLYPATSFYVVTISSSYRSATGKNFVNKKNDICYRGETAWAANGNIPLVYRYVSKGNWATYTKYEGTKKTVKIYAGQTIDVGTATFSAPVNGKVTITINLKNGVSFADVKENLKIQGYAAVPPAQNPAPGKFTTYKGTISGSSTTVTVPQYAYYGIHLDVKVPCSLK
ncbi:MAG: hypothetical protein H5T43_01960 [Methanomethylovorans sp.]|jgi:hypothetical protein|nr:hypothetical protein [Methanomethylovorans sp.]